MMREPCVPAGEPGAPGRGPCLIAGSRCSQTVDQGLAPTGSASS